MRYAYYALAFIVVAVLSLAGFRGCTSTRSPIELFDDMVFIPMGKVEIGQRHFAAVRQVAAHQQMMAEVRLRPVRRPEVAHHIVGSVLAT